MSYESGTVQRAASIPGVAGVKDSTFDLGYLNRLVTALGNRDDFSILIGPETLLLQGLKLGAHGAVCGGSNLNPSLLVALVQAFRQGDLTRAEELQDRVTAMNDSIYTVGEPVTGYLRGLKCALSLMGIGTGVCSPPFRPFSPGEIEEVRRRMEALNLLGRPASSAV
jgi:4-hydroxy-tetrahydrodipicolinate synthase